MMISLLQVIDHWLVIYLKIVNLLNISFAKEIVSAKAGYKIHIMSLRDL